MKCSIEEKRNILEQAKGQFFHVCFKKKDNTIREMTCKKYIRKAFANGESSTGKNSFEDKPEYYLAVDMAKEEFRAVNLNTLISCKVNGKTYSFEGEE